MEVIPNELTFYKFAGFACLIFGNGKKNLFSRDAVCSLVRRTVMLMLFGLSGATYAVHTAMAGEPLESSEADLFMNLKQFVSIGFYKTSKVKPKIKRIKRK